jgi:hypothetical protein
MKSYKSFLTNQKGQIAVESVLIAVIMTGLAMAAHRFIQNSNMLGNYVQNPWQQVAGMIENGIWADAQKARLNHPGKLYRHLSLQGEQE